MQTKRIIQRVEFNKNLTMNTRVIIASLWISHFLLWTFGDMVSLLQKMSDSVENSLLLYVAIPLAITQTLMIYFSLTAKQNVIRWANIILSIVFLVFNIGFITEATTGWEYFLGSGYILFNLLIIKHAWKWCKTAA